VSNSSTAQQTLIAAGAGASLRAGGTGSPGESRLKAERVQLLLEALPGWRLSPGGGSISRSFRFPAAGSALAFTQFVTALAGETGHTPAVSLEGLRVTCRLTTAAAGGLTLQDFELAQRISLRT
jgi:4a-hydroxytetrahydrobiopterin dehydratase